MCVATTSDLTTSVPKLRTGLCSCRYICHYQLVGLSKYDKPQEFVPVHPVHQVQDWDAAEGAISWDRLIKFLRRLKQTGQIPNDHRSHDHLNEQREVTIDGEMREKWRQNFANLKKANEGGENVVWIFVDGFLLYWHKVRCGVVTWYYMSDAKIYVGSI